MEFKHYDDPFDYFIIDNFLDEDVAHKLASEFPDYNHPKWFKYENPLEVKRAMNDWYEFPPTTYEFFHYLNSSDFIQGIKETTGIDDIFPDLGLHGGGWHIHGNGGKLNIHQDYSIHPKMDLQRKFNLIIYLSEDWDSSWGGNLEFWSHDIDKNRPKEKRAEIECKFNRAILFDASQFSWHGFPEAINCPEGKYRKSIASYYLTIPNENTSPRKRALYSPTKEQENDPEILKLIAQRSK